MHLLAAQPGGFVVDEGIVDLGQTPADIVVLSAADSLLAALATSVESLPADYPSVRLANWMQLIKPAAFDLYQDAVLDKAKVVIVSLLGGQNYWQYGFDRLQQWLSQSTSENPRKLILVPGDDSPDSALFEASNVNKETHDRIWRYLREGGVANQQQLFFYIAEQFLNQHYLWHEPETLPHCLIYMPLIEEKADKGREFVRRGQVSFVDWQKRWQRTTKKGAAVCALVFYKSHLQSANTAMFDELIACIEAQGLRPLPVAISSLKDPESMALLNALIEQSQAKLIINTTGFSSHRVSAPELSSQPVPFISPFSLSVPVFQLILSSSTLDDWTTYSQGLRSRDIAMQVVLPEMDGRIITRAISFKAEAYFSERSEISIVRYKLHEERAQFVVELASAFCRLSEKSNPNKRVALILANYPIKDGRIGNGVGLDTPASTIEILKALKQNQYVVDNIPSDGTSLIESLQKMVTNNPETIPLLPCMQSISISDYNQYFALLPQDSQNEILKRWGPPEQDPKTRNGRIMLSGLRLGEVFVGIQPARGFNLDLAANYHDPDLVPPHSYLAFYFWLRHCYQIDAVVHVGKHGSLEWLPGKGTALSENCWPDIILGPTPHFYPFIVNDPGEGAQAKRRTQAVIIDHLMPPMTRAEVYGPLAELEKLVDEYYQAMGMDDRRASWLKGKILEQVKISHVYEELGLKNENVSEPNESEVENSEVETSKVENSELENSEAKNEVLLSQLDTYLCDIKEAQIRNGLHILGLLPDTEKLADTIVALLRLPRGKDDNSQGILHNLVIDLNLCNQSETHFDPLTISVKNWEGTQPELLVLVSSALWRTEADTRERLELLALNLVEQMLDDFTHLSHYKTRIPRTYNQLKYAQQTILGALKLSAHQEIQSLINGLNGQFVPPGPSGAPTRGRLDTLPTGRNFYSVDNRSIPSQAAWAIGQKSAQALIERHLQEHGDYPVQIGLSVWGTATMRTGGDDIAQAFALMGVKPIWAPGSQRVIDFEIVPAMLLARPRVDVTLRVSGFFRDAFPNVMQLFDAAVLAIAELDEPGNSNTIRQNIETQIEQLCVQGLSREQAQRQASYRVFGSKPGAYGAGLQGLIDERCWEHQSDLAEAYLNWGGYAYGSKKFDVDGVEAKQSFQHQLSQLQVVVQNQDNREHDILDSDDYYQFQGGMSNAVSVYAGESPTVYHNDLSNPASPKVRTLKEELNRVIRSRVLNPKWINAMREHGYKGAFEMAASVDYLFAYDATTNLIDNYQYEQVTDRLIFDAENQAFLQENNPKALEEMSERLLEASQRGLWQAPTDYIDKIQDLLLDIDAREEGQH